MKALVVLVATAALATPAQYLQAHQRPDGSFAEQGGIPGIALTAWAALGVAAAGEDPGAALDYLRAHEAEAEEPVTRALVALATAALGDDGLASRLDPRPDATNAIVWTVLALRQAGTPAPPALVRELVRRQSPSGGWGWAAGVAPDSNDTAAAVEALRAASVTGAPVRRGLAYLRRFQGKDGGFALSPGRGSDAQSTAWAVQAFLAAGKRPPRGALAYLRRLRRPDGSYRYSARYATTPVWVTAQVLPALAGRPFPLRPSGS